MAGGVAEETRFELVRTEEPFHARLVVHQQRPHQMPVAGLVESKDAAG